MEVQGMEKLLTTQEVADYLGLTRRTIYTYIENKTLPAVKIGKEWRVKKTELEAFINRGSGEIKEKED
jgi:excisionase family DNA binding protein